MSLKNLESQGKIKRVPVDPDTVSRLMEIADRDLSSAKRNFQERDDEWAYNIAYNALLQAGTCLMHTQGYRPEGREHHYSVELFLSHFLDRNEITIFSRMRKQRHNSVYDRVGAISHTDAESALRNAEVSINRIKTLVRNMGFVIS